MYIRFCGAATLTPVIILNTNVRLLLYQNLNIFLSLIPLVNVFFWLSRGQRETAENMTQTPTIEKKNVFVFG